MKDTLTVAPISKDLKKVALPPGELKLLSDIYDALRFITRNERIPKPVLADAAHYALTRIQYYKKRKA